jgi:NADH-quinone oxidoreductase subunit M
MPESDLIWMSVLVFLPAAFAAALLLFPPRWAEPMRWFALFGTAGTLAVSLCVLVDYYAMLDSRMDKNGRPLAYPVKTVRIPNTAATVKARNRT